MKTCPDCGCNVYSRGCVNCDEPAYIAQQEALTAEQYPEAPSLTPRAGGEADPESISLAAERAADRLRKALPDLLARSVLDRTRAKVVEHVDRLDAARVLLQSYEVAEQEIRNQVEGTVHEQPAIVTGPAYLMAVFESMRVARSVGDGA